MAQEQGSTVTQDSTFGELEQYEGEFTEGSRRKRQFNKWKDTLSEHWGLLVEDRLVVFGMATIGFFVLVAIAAPYLAPYGQTERLFDDMGMIAQWEPPVWAGGEYFLGTTAEGYHIFSQLIYGSRPALIVGLTAAFFTATIGTTVALISGYYGGYVDDFLMRIVDVAYGLPLLPTVILMVAVLGPSYVNVIIAVVILQWRSPARVIRSQVLSIRERSYVRSARVAGATDWRIISRHIAPNVLPLTFLYGAFAVAWAILTEAGVSFLGLGDPSQVSWGTMLQSAHTYNSMVHGAWYWFIPPGICIALVVISAFLIGRGYEEVTNPQLRSMGR